jgi:hypothetical protein
MAKVGIIIEDIQNNLVSVAVQSSNPDEKRNASKPRSR